jgi:hypothetical protein
MKQLCDDLRQFAIQVRQLGYCLDGGVESRNAWISGRAPILREIVDAYRGWPPTPPFNYVPELLGHGAPHFREVSDWDPHYHIGHLALGR